jgi:hypothetical protein
MLWTADEITTAAENQVVEILRTNGWKILERGAYSLGMSDIMASVGSKRIVVKVKYGVSPSPPPALTDAEKFAFEARSKRLKAEPWVARLQLDSDTLRLIGPCDWDRLG